MSNITTQDIPGLDHDLPEAVLGCDPGPTHCAFALVERTGDRLKFSGVWYFSVADTVANMHYGLFSPVGRDRPFYFVFEKMTARYGAVPGALTFDTARNAGVAVADIAMHPMCRGIAAVSTTDWRVVFGGSTHMSDAEVRAELLNLYGKELDKAVRGASDAAKKNYGLAKPPAVHMRDALAVATSAYLFPRRGVGVTKYGLYSFPEGPDAK